VPFHAAPEKASVYLDLAYQIKNLGILPPNFRLEWHKGGLPMVKFLLWCILFVLCWPLALLALILYPIVWVLLLPFRIVGIAVGGVLSLIWALITLPARILRKI
jgi:hypothetical protein